MRQSATGLGSAGFPPYILAGNSCWCERMRLAFDILLVIVVMTVSAVMPAAAASMHCAPQAAALQHGALHDHAASTHHENDGSSRPADPQPIADCAWRCLNACAGVIIPAPVVASPFSPPARLHAAVTTDPLTGLPVPPLLRPPRTVFA